MCLSLFKLLLIAGIAFGSFSLRAQTFCRKASVYFDLDKDAVRPEMKTRIDSLFASMSGKDVLVELYGYTDSMASGDYNQALSERRTGAVKTYISANYPAAFKFMEQSLGESKVSADSRQDRRVDLFLVPVQNGRIVLENERETVSLPIDYFEPCGVCLSRPKMEAYYTDAEAEAAGFRFRTSDNRALITAGTVNFQMDPCDQSKKKQEICISVKASQLDRDMKVWEPDTINGLILWKPSKYQPIFDSSNNCYILCSPLRLFNFDKPAPGSLIIFPYSRVRSSFYTKEWDRVNVSREDTIPFGWPDTVKTVVSMGKSDGKTFYLKENLRTLTKRIDTTGNLKGFRAYVVPLSYYTEFRFSDTLLSVKFGSRARPEKFGFYLADINEFIPVETVRKGRYTTGKPINDCELAYLKKGKVYVLDQQKAKLSYKRKKNTYKARFTARKSKAFRRNKHWKP